MIAYRFRYKLGGRSFLEGWVQFIFWLLQPHLALLSCRRSVVLFFLQFRRILCWDFGPFWGEGLDDIISVFLGDDLLALLADLLGHLSSTLQQPVKGLLNSSSWNLHQFCNNKQCTFGILDLLIFGAVDFGLDVIGVLPSLVQNWGEDLVSILWTDLEHLTGSILQGLPPFLGLRLQLGRLSGFYLRIQVISCLLDPSLEIPAHGGEDIIEELARSSDDLLDVIRKVNLLLLQIRVMLLNTRPDLSFLDCCRVNDQPCSVRDDLFKIGDWGGVSEQRNGRESVLKMREDIGNGVLVDHLNEVDVLMDAVIETANIDEIGRVGPAAV